MASTPSAITPLGKHDVFLSFRGKDTRNNFVSVLHRELVARNGIETYIDYRLDGGEEIEPALLEKIQESLISVVIFSKNYADSTFCLRELSKILECKETKGQIVLPVFYEVDPTEIQELSAGSTKKEEEELSIGSFRKALNKHKRSHYNKEEVLHWEHTLTEIANLKGWDSNVTKPDTILVDKIVDDIQKKLHQMPSSDSAWSDTKRLVGIDSRVNEVESLLCIGSPDVLITVGLWGMPGIGKTTVAEVVYRRLSPQFEGRCFFRNFREESNKHGLLHVRKLILQEVLEVQNLDNLLDSNIARMLQRRKVLIVLDDVSSSLQLKEALGDLDGLLCQGSRIIVTSRDKQVLEIRCDKTYEVEELGYIEAVQLFKQHAFKGNQCREGFKELSERAVNYAKGNPLSLKVLGSNLYNKRIKEWENALANLKGTLDPEIQKILMMGYDGLDWKQKRIFLDIACFFGRSNRYLVQHVLDHCGFNAESGIDRLIDVSLLNISENEIWMHDLLQQLGQDIVHQENFDDPRKRSRLWIPEDIDHVLTHHQGAETVQAISLDLSKIEVTNLSPTVFEGICNLRLLKFSSANQSMCRGKLIVPKSLTYLPKKLRVLHWDYYPLESLPSNFCAKNLVELQMRLCGNLKFFHDNQHFENLMSLEITWNWNLSSVDPILSKAPNLKVLKLVGIGLIKTLDLSKVCNLEVLKLSGCGNLLEVPSSIKHCTKLTTLKVHKCFTFRTLPSEIGYLSQLVVLKLKGSEKLESLPHSIGQLKCLEKLDLSEHLNLSSLPNSIGSLVSLRELDLSRNKNFEVIPTSIKKLPKLTTLNLSDCDVIRVLPELPASLHILNAAGCRSLQSVAGIFTQCEREYEAASESFIFSECFVLGQNDRLKIMADAQLRIQRMAKCLFGEVHKSGKVNESDEPLEARFCVPGSEIPEWFEFKNTKGSSLKSIRRPDNSSAEFLGFAFFAVVSFEEILVDLKTLCECHFISTEGGSQSSDAHVISYSKNWQILGWRSQYVLIWYDWNINSTCFFNEASFHFKASTLSEYGTLDEVEVMKCGVHLLFA